MKAQPRTSLTFSLSSVNCSRLSVPSHSPPRSQTPQLAAFSCSVALEIDHLSPPTIFSSLIESRNPISSEITAEESFSVLARWLLGALRVRCQPWMNSNSFVCYQRECRCTSLLWRVVKLKHSSQGHCHPHLGRINHRLQDGRPLVMLTWYVAVWHLLNLLSSCCRASSVPGSAAAARGVDLKVRVITRSWQTSAEVTGSSRLDGWRFGWVRWDFIRETVTSFNGALSSCQCIIRRKTVKKDRGNNGCREKRSERQACYRFQYTLASHRFPQQKRK